MNKNILYCSLIMFLILSAKANCQNDSAQCYPPCRPGYTCHKGECVSLCNPPCPIGTECLKGLACIPISSYNNSRTPTLITNPYTTHYGQIATGTILTLVGAGIIIGAIVSMDISQAESLTRDIGGASGAVLFTIGIPTLIVGAVNQSKYNNWENTHDK